MSCLTVGYLIAVLFWIDCWQQHHSLCMWRMKSQRHHFFFFLVWLHEYTKRLGFFCASNQTINVSLPCLDYIQVISICGILDSYQCILFEVCCKKICNLINGVVPSNRHSNLANCSVSIISLLMWCWINVTSAKKVKIQLN